MTRSEEESAALREAHARGYREGVEAEREVALSFHMPSYWRGYLEGLERAMDLTEAERLEMVEPPCAEDRAYDQAIDDVLRAIRAEAATPSPQLRDGEPRASGRHCPLASEPSAEAWCKSTHRGWDCELSANHAGNHHAWCEGYGAIDWDSEPAAVPDVPPPPRTLEDRGGLAGLWTTDVPPREDQPHISDFRRHNRVPREPEEPQ